MKKCFKYFLITIFIFLFNILSVSADENVELTKVELKEKSDYVEINEEVSLDGNKIVSNVNFYDEGDYVIYKFTIKNNDNKEYKIDEIIDNNNSEYLDFEYTYDGDLVANSEKDILLKITYKSALPYDSVLTPENVYNATEEINISVKLEEIVKEDIDNPNTFDNAKIYLVLEVVGVIGLSIIFIKLKKKNAALLLLLTLLIIPKNTSAQLEFELKFSFKNTMSVKANFLKAQWKNSMSLPYTKIEFVRVPDFPEGASDVSEKGDGSIKLWKEGETVYIGSRYKIFFPSNTNGFFRNLGITELEFNDMVDTTFVTNMGNMFENCRKLSSLDVRSFRMGNVTNMSYMFEYLGADASDILIEADDLDTSNVTSANGVFEGVGQNAYNITINAANFNFSKASDFQRMFSNVGRSRGDKIIINVPNWILTGGTSTHYMFSQIGSYDKTKELEIDATNWDTSTITTMEETFYSTMGGTEKFVINVTGWDTSSVENMHNTFYYTAAYANEFGVIGLDTWDVSSVQNMNGMFYSAGTNTNKFVIDLSNWDTSSVSTFSMMFAHSAFKAQEISIGDLSNWDFRNATNVSLMFYNFANMAESNFDIGTLDIYAIYIGDFLSGCKRVNAVINLHNNPSTYGNAFGGASMVEGTQTVVNYTIDVTSIDNIVATKYYDSSNVVKGSLIEA